MKIIVSRVFLPFTADFVGKVVETVVVVFLVVVVLFLVVVIVLLLIVDAVA